MLVDLHLHTTASDGRLTPRQLVLAAAAARMNVIAVTDHDTVAACSEVQALAREHGVEAVAGIEITAVEDGRDIHMLGYFLETEDAALNQFLAAQRTIRHARVRQIAQRLDELGMPVDVAPFITVAPGRTVGRPQVADAMIAAGHVSNRREAFERWLGAGRPAFVPREGAAPEYVIETVHRVNGIVSLAHPGRTALADERIESLSAAGLDAIEVYHSDHDGAAVTRYAALADRLGVLRTGGSDFHGDSTAAVAIGTALLPDAHWQRLRETADRKRSGA